LLAFGIVLANVSVKQCRLLTALWLAAFLALSRREQTPSLHRW
jgi:hypothetical protein